MSDERKYTEIRKWNDRLEMLGYDIMALISNGEKENVNDIISHFEKSDLVHYLIGKYKDQMSLISEDSPYNIDEWEKVFEQYSYMTYGHDVKRKMGFVNEDEDGLLLLLNIILLEVAGRRYK